MRCVSAADFMRKIDHVAMPKCDRLSDGLANWNAIIRTFAAAPLATADVVARNGRRNRDEHSHGRCGEKRGSRDAVDFHRHTSGHAKRSEWSLSNSCLRAPFPA